MYFLIENDDLMEKCNNIYNKVSADIKKEFDCEPVFNNFFFLKTKIKYCGDEVAYFCDKAIPKIDSNQTCLAVMSLGSALNEDGS